MLVNAFSSETKNKTKQFVKVCQLKTSRFVNLMGISHFGARLRLAFKNAKNAEIARQIGVSEAAIKNYVDGRIPDAEKLIKIRNLTNCSLDWLLTGEGSPMIGGRHEFDIEHSIELHDDWRQVMKDWYDFEGGEMPDTLGASFMGGWQGFSMGEKINALRDFKKLLDMATEDE